MDVFPYEDIVNLPHHVSRRHPAMPLHGRAAQFAPFAALTGYEEVIDETARPTEERRELADDARALLDMHLKLLAAHLAEQPWVTVTYFVPDQRKQGGRYLRVTGRLLAIMRSEQALRLADGTAIPIHELYAIDSPLLDR